MYETGLAFGERVALLDGAPTRLPGTVLLPPGQIRPGPGAPTPRPVNAPLSGGVWLPGTDATVRGRVEHAVNPVAERRRSEAAHTLSLRLKAQDDNDIEAAERLAPASNDELRFAEAVMDLGAWRYKIDNMPPGVQLAALLEQRPEHFAPAPGKGPVICAEGDDGVPGSAEPVDRGWPDAVLASITARHKLIAHLQAAQYADIAALSGCYNGIHQFLATELALALHMTDAEGAALLGAAEALRDRLPGTQQALAAGRIDDGKAMALIHATASTTADVARTVEEKVLPNAEKVTVTTVRRRAGRAVIAADPDGVADRHRRARAERHAWRAPEQDGMARFGIYAPAQDVATIWEAVTAVADAIRGSGDTRTLGQRRVDALVMICSDILGAGGWHNLKVADKGLGRPRINVTIPYTVLLGHRAPCELAGHGPISSEQAQFLAGTGDLYRMICDPVTGQLLDYGRERYRPPPHLAEFVRARDGECPMPSCHQPAGRGQLDHIVPAKPDAVTGKPTLGTTCADNLAPPCPHDHLSKDAGRGFTLHRSADGTYTWTTPLGRIYTWRPEPLWHLDTDDVPRGAGLDAGDGTGADSCRASRPCACLPRTGPATGQGGDACAGQWRSFIEPHDLLPALAIDSDWADGFLTNGTNELHPDGRARAGAGAGLGLGLGAQAEAEASSDVPLATTGAEAEAHNDTILATTDPPGAIVNHSVATPHAARVTEPEHSGSSVHADDPPPF